MGTYLNITHASTKIYVITARCGVEIHEGVEEFRDSPGLLSRKATAVEKLLIFQCFFQLSARAPRARGVWGGYVGVKILLLGNSFHPEIVSGPKSTRRKGVFPLIRGLPGQFGTPPGGIDKCHPGEKSAKILKLIHFHCLNSEFDYESPAGLR